jgi:hypothetical protein
MTSVLLALSVFFSLISGARNAVNTRLPDSPDNNSGAPAESTTPDQDPQPETLFVPALFSGIVLTPDSFEPDDDYTSATPISGGDIQRHNILPEGDEDWLIFDVAALSEVVIETAGPFYDLDTPIDWNTRVYLKDADRFILEINNDFSDDYYSRIDRQCGSDDELNAGTYYIKIENGSGDYPDGSDILTVPKYDVTISITACP